MSKKGRLYWCITDPTRESCRLAWFAPVVVKKAPTRTQILCNGAAACVEELEGTGLNTRISAVRKVRVIIEEVGK